MLLMIKCKGRQFFGDRFEIKQFVWYNMVGNDCTQSDMQLFESQVGGRHKERPKLLAQIWNECEQLKVA